MQELSTFAAFFAAGASLYAVSRIARLEQSATSLSRLDAKLDAILKHAGVDFDPYSNVPAGVAEALSRGEKILAIKAYREASGADLKAAKEYVEEVQRRAGG